MSSDIFAAVKRFYEDPVVVARYASNDELTRGEKAMLKRYSDEIAGANLLDIGVGAGRTTPYLMEASAAYTGIDYSEAMLGRCRAKWPQARLLWCDARDLSVFESGAFGAVWAVLSGLDDVGHEDRLRMLHEIHRVTWPQGLFIFSAHNRDTVLRSAYRPPRPALVVHPGVTLHENARRLRHWVVGIRNHLRNHQSEQRQADYAVLNDQSNNFGLLTHYIRQEDQLAQLRAIGFRPLEVIDCRGATLREGEPSRDPWLHYVAQRVSRAVTVNSLPAPAAVVNREAVAGESNAFTMQLVPPPDLLNVREAPPTHRLRFVAARSRCSDPTA